MAKRLRTLGIILAVIGLGFTVAGAVAYTMTQDGYDSLEAFSAAQNVELSYNEDGQLIDRGTVEGAQGIMELLTEEWGYPVVESELDPADPVVNTASEYMFQMATIGYHTLHGTQTVVLTDTVEYNGEVFEAGTYEFPSTAATGPTSTDATRSRDPPAAKPGQAPPTASSQNSASAPSPPAP